MFCTVGRRPCCDSPCPVSCDVDPRVRKLRCLFCLDTLRWLGTYTVSIVPRTDFEAALADCWFWGNFPCPIIVTEFDDVTFAAPGFVTCSGTLTVIRFRRPSARHGDATFRAEN